MNQIAFILEHTTIYWHSIILALAVLAGICFFMACCHHIKIPTVWSSAAALVSVVLSLLLARFLYWYSRPDGFNSLMQAMTTSASGNYALTGVFFGCALTALLIGKRTGSIPALFDCMSVAGCGAIALGRLGSFFTASDRGQIMTEMTYLPWAYPVLNPASGMPDYRFATFLFQSVIAGLLFLVLCWLFFSPRRKPLPQGDVTLLFGMVYSASQVILDSTRYDSLYFRSNGFVSIVQVLCAVVLGVSIIFICLRAVKARGFQKWMPICWGIFAALFGLAGFMEYYVQRHGRLAMFSYGIMEHCLVGILVLGIWLWSLSLKKVETIYHKPQAQPSEPKASILNQLKVKAPNVKMPKLKMPEIKLPEVKKPEIKKPEAKQPEVKKPETAEPEARDSDLEEFNLESFSLEEFDLKEFDLEDFDLQDIDLQKAFDFE